MAKPYSKLRHALEDADIDRADICAKLHKSPTYVAHRFTLHQPWTLDDAYSILEMLGEPSDKLPYYFPCDGGMAI